MPDIATLATARRGHYSRDPAALRSVRFSGISAWTMKAIRITLYSVPLDIGMNLKVVLGRIGIGRDAAPGLGIDINEAVLGDPIGVLERAHPALRVAWHHHEGEAQRAT